MSTTYRIGDLAREFELTPRAMRFYEDMGLLTPERTGPGGTQRLYSGRDRVRLMLTLRAKRLGLSLIEAKALIDMYDSPRDTGPQLERFLQVLGEHRSQLEARMAELQATLREIKGHEREARSLLDGLGAPRKSGKSSSAPAAGQPARATVKSPARATKSPVVAKTAKSVANRAKRTAVKAGGKAAGG